MREKATIKARVRPQKVAVAIPADTSDSGFRDILNFLGWLWGGKYSCIILIDLDDEENDLAFSWLAQYSPDLVLCASQEVREVLEGRIQEVTDPPFQILELHTPLEKNFHINHGGLMPWNCAYDRYVKEINSRPGTKTRYTFLSTSPEIENRIFYDLSFGVQTKEGCEALAQQLKANTQCVENWNVVDFISRHGDSDNPFSYLDFTALEVEKVNSLWSAPTIFVLSRDLLDYAWFWNCRFDFSSGGNNCIPIPVDSIDDEPTLRSLSSWVGGYHFGRASYCFIKSISASQASLDRLARRLRPRVKKYGCNHVDVILEQEHKIPCVNLQHGIHNITATWRDQDSFEFCLPMPSFVDEINKKTSFSWVVEIVDGRDNIEEHIPPQVAYKTNTRILNAPSPASPSCPIEGFFRRYSFGTIHISCNVGMSEIAVTLPTADELLIPYLRDLGIEAIPDEKRTCYDAAFGLFEGRKHFSECCKDVRYAILSSLWDGRDVPCEKNGHSFSKGCHVRQTDSPVPVTIGHVKRKAKTGKGGWSKPFVAAVFHPPDPLMAEIYKIRLTRESSFYRRNTPSSFLAWLVERSIVRRVFRYPECPYCKSKSNWISKVDLERPLRCSRCGGRIAFDESKFDMEYQLNPLVSRAFNEGVRPVALTLNVLEQASDGFMYVPGFKGKMNGNVFDIDIIAICNGRLVLCECKDMEDVPTDSHDWKKIEKQFSKLIDLGTLCQACSVVLASFANGYPQSIKDMMKSKSTTSMRVVLLTKEELERGNVQIRRDDKSSYKGYFSEVFCPQQKHRKKRKTGKRVISFG